MKGPGFLTRLSAEKKQALIEALKNTSGPGEVKQVLDAAGIEVSEKKIMDYIDKHSRGRTELSDEELRDVAGGSFYGITDFKSPAEVTFVAEIGQVLEVSNGWGFNATVRCRITDRKIEERTVVDGIMVVSTHHYYYDRYYVVPLEEHWYFSADWVGRNAIEK